MEKPVRFMSGSLPEDTAKKAQDFLKNTFFEMSPAKFTNKLIEFAVSLDEKTLIALIREPKEMAARFCKVYKNN